GKRSGVYAEPSMMEACYNEFEDLEEMISAAEGLYGKYAWEQYDVIVLPPSFPFGGMENPRLTFATPTIIAGDKSLTSLIAHELAHSWSGNLATNATWDDFWLNEGFTVYFEGRIIEELYGKDYADMLAVLSYQGLLDELEELPKEDTRLKLDLEGRSPDDGMSAIAYDKGCFMLRMIEENVGREKFDSFLNAYFDNFKFKNLTTEEFLVYINKELPEVQKLNLNEWIYKPGLPANCPK
ncbi:MAG: M1 family aminopeptidase, partial [Flavobacteriales bacterium]